METILICPNCRIELDVPENTRAQCPKCNKLVKPIKGKKIEESSVFKRLENKVEDGKVERGEK